MASIIIDGTTYSGIEEVYLPNVGGVEDQFTLPPSGSIPINSNGTVDVSAYQYANVSVPTGADTSDATATAADILFGKTAYIASGKTTGTITSKSAQTYTPGTSNQTINAGQYLTGAQTIKGDSNLIPANIAKDVSIFGVQGVHEGGGVTIEEGDITAVGGESMISTGCTFIPDIVLVYTDEHYYEGGFDFGQTPLSFYVTNKSAGNVYSGIGQYGDSQDNDPAYMIWSGYLYIQQDTFHLGSFWEQAVNGEWWFTTKTYHWVAVKYT